MYTADLPHSGKEEVLKEESTIRSDLLQVERKIGLLSFKEHMRRQKELQN